MAGVRQSIILTISRGSFYYYYIYIVTYEIHQLSINAIVRPTCTQSCCARVVLYNHRFCKISKTCSLRFERCDLVGIFLTFSMPTIILESFIKIVKVDFEKNCIPTCSQIKKMRIFWDL